MQKRIDWIDCAKGITILLVIIGHTLWGMDRGLIFSFHMPLFFILSCATYKLSKDSNEFSRKIKKSFRHLLVPAIIMYGIVTVSMLSAEMIGLGEAFSLAIFLQNRALTLLFSSGVTVDFIRIRIAPIGIIWFFFALFMGRTLYDYLHLHLKKHLPIICIVLSVIGVIVGQFVWLPFSLDIVLAIMPLFWIGVNWGVLHLEEQVAKKLTLSFIAWLGLFSMVYLISGSYMELACRRYTWYPICYAVAVLGTIMISEVSVLLCQVRKFAEPLIYLGKNSLYLLCIHILDDEIFSFIWHVSQNEYINAGARVLFNLLLFGMFMYLMNLYKKYHVK